ncbi:MAG: hypothetical protein ACK5QT_08215 [Oligoflexia bacterium]
MKKRYTEEQIIGVLKLLGMEVSDATCARVGQWCASSVVNGG